MSSQSRFGDSLRFQKEMEKQDFVVAGSERALSLVQVSLYTIAEWGEGMLSTKLCVCLNEQTLKWEVCWSSWDDKKVKDSLSGTSSEVKARRRNALKNT